MSNDKVRAEFEAWWQGKYGDSLYCESAWRGWQASREALVVELPESITMSNGYSYDDDYYNLALSRCRDRILSAGVRVKP